MSSDWIMTSIGEITNVVTKGTTPTSIGFHFREAGINYVKSESITFDGRIEKSKFAFIDSNAHDALKRSQLQRGDILFSMAGVYIGKTAVVKDDILPANTNQAVGIIRINAQKAHSEYIDFCLRNPALRTYANSLVAQSAQPNLNLAEIKGLPINLPPLWEQKAIAHILGTLDDKIELNRKTNETLEAMAKALFKSWFVDFDPVRAKAESRPTGLPAEISDLFPDLFEDSELGEIPSGWRDGEIQDIAELNPETWGSRNQPLGVRYLDLSNVKHGRIDSIEEYQWEDAPSRARRILKTGDTVLGTVRPGNGSYCLIGEDGITGSTGFAVLRPKNKNDSAFVYLGSCSKENIDRLAHLADGGAYPAVRPELVAQTPVIIAARDVLDCFSRSVSPLFTAAEDSKQSSKLLCQVRDALLPKLISGELRIPDAEKLLESVR
jgi:type I restriction enzyme S subunit